jgi:hypothetical protein
MASKAAISTAVGRSMMSASKNPPPPPSSSKAKPPNSGPNGVAGGSQAVTIPVTGKHASKAAAPVVPIKSAGGAANVSSAAQPAVPRSGRRFTSPLKPVVLNNHQESASAAPPAPEMPTINEASSAALFAMISSKVPSFLRFANRWHELSMCGRDLVISYKSVRRHR